MVGEAQDTFRVTLLGSGAPPPILDRFGPSTLVEVGSEKFIFDAGRGAMQRLHQLKIPFADITGIFLTHHHSDHLVGFTDLGSRDGLGGRGAGATYPCMSGVRRERNRWWNICRWRSP